MSPRAFVFALWCANSKSAARTVDALEAIATNQASVSNEGGRVLVSASMGGKSYSYQLPPDMTAGTVADMALRCWQQVRSYTDAQLETWLMRRESRVMLASFNTYIPADTLTNPPASTAEAVPETIEVMSANGTVFRVRANDDGTIQTTPKT